MNVLCLIIYTYILYDIYIYIYVLPTVTIKLLPDTLGGCENVCESKAKEATDPKLGPPGGPLVVSHRRP